MKFVVDFVFAVLHAQQGFIHSPLPTCVSLITANAPDIRKWVARLWLRSISCGVNTDFLDVLPSPLHFGPFFNASIIAHFDVAYLLIFGVRCGDRPSHYFGCCCFYSALEIRKTCRADFICKGIQLSLWRVLASLFIALVSGRPTLWNLFPITVKKTKQNLI